MVLDITQADGTTIGCGEIRTSTAGNVARDFRRILSRAGLTPTDELAALL